MRRARLELRPIDPTLVSGKHTDYASFISLFAPAFPDAGELISLVSNDLTLETSCTDFLVYASAGMITV